MWQTQGHTMTQSDLSIRNSWTSAVPGFGLVAKDTNIRMELHLDSQGVHKFTGDSVCDTQSQYNLCVRETCLFDWHWMTLCEGITLNSIGNAEVGKATLVENQVPVAHLPVPFLMGLLWRCTSGCSSLGFAALFPSCTEWLWTSKGR